MIWTFQGHRPTSPTELVLVWMLDGIMPDSTEDMRYNGTAMTLELYMSSASMY
ncbi:hypothetical protein CHS0354_021120, partial [Potamilus streckersoni]